MTKPKKNTMFPGRPNYTGPKSGVFGLLHHSILCERSHDVMERVYYVRWFKAAAEVKIRLHNMICLDDCPAAKKRDALRADYGEKLAPLYADYNAKLALLYADYQAKRGALNNYEAKRDALYADYDAKLASLDAEIVAYIHKHIPNCAWNGRNLGWE